MLDATVKLETMRDMFLYGNQLYSWTLTDDLRLVYSNCPHQQFFHAAFVSNAVSDLLLAHFKTGRRPAIVTDEMGLAWMGAAAPAEGEITAYFMLGPFFTVEASQTYINQMCTKSRSSSLLIQELTDKLQDLPTIALNQAVHYAVMLHFCVSGEVITPADVTQCNEYDSTAQPDFADGETNPHGTWEMEQELFSNIRKGRLVNMAEIAAKFSGGHVGVMSEDALRQAKNETIIFAALSCRAAVQGGMSAEGGYNLADYYIRLVESSDNIGAIQQLGSELYETFTRRVHQCRKNRKYLPIVAAALEYIETHIMEKISLNAMGRELGYTAYYISDKFQKEMGTNINSYIKSRKIDLAKEYLLHSHLSQAEISDRLAFSSPSYFASTFRKITGMAPTEFLQSTCEKE